jgi:hypothetical protein
MSSDYQLEDTIFLPFTTRALTGIPTALLGTPLVDIYEDATATPIVTSETLVVSLNSKVGFNMITVTATGASGFNVGGHYTAILNAGTVDGVSVIGEVVGEFTIDSSAAAQDLANATDGLTALRTLLLDIPTSGEFNARTLLTADYFDPAEDTVATVTTLTGHTPQTGDSFARIGVAGAGLTDITLNAASIDLIWDEVGTGATHNVVDSFGRRIRDLQEFGVYEKGAVWIDTVNGAAGTTTFENGTAFNPVLTLADALTLAAAVNLVRFEIAPGSTITFAEVHTNELWEGDGWTLELGGQNIAGTTIRNASVSGISTGVPNALRDCFVSTATFAGGDFISCALAGTITLSGAIEYHFFNSHHANSATIDFGVAVLNTTVHMHEYVGALIVDNMGQAGTDILHFDSPGGKLTLNASCIGGTANLNGTFDLVDNSSGMTINNDGDIVSLVESLNNISATDVNTQVLDVLNVDMFALPGQLAPPLTPTLVECATWIYKLMRNRTDQTATLFQVYADDEATVDAKATISDDTVTAIKQELVSGP